MHYPPLITVVRQRNKQKSHLKHKSSIKHVLIFAYVVTIDSNVGSFECLSFRKATIRLEWWGKDSPLIEYSRGKVPPRVRFLRS